ncbi:hypothetical protein OPV22_027705 [Ensete ventricosum]|uniref:Uncharacterized protein n=1 Tax=Ensete ventricosum TaxID=4639 RepID=A0AAV8Q646_ENSVE|nr:hypothetical protein OPV22_027705 [Ensete ventricosum]
MKKDGIAGSDPSFHKVEVSFLSSTGIIHPFLPSWPGENKNPAYWPSLLPHVLLPSTSPYPGAHCFEIKQAL